VQPNPQTGAPDKNPDPDSLPDQGQTKLLARTAVSFAVYRKLVLPDENSTQTTSVQGRC